MTPLPRLAPVLLALVAAACASTAPTLPPVHFEAWDADANGLVDRTEFLTHFSRTPVDRAWDRDRDGAIDRTEFADATYRTWDQDADGFLSDVEWRASVLRWDADGVTFGPFGHWDADGDGRLARTEFDARIGLSGLYDVWDGDLDRHVTLAELGAGFYRLWDRDGSGYLDDGEWGDGERLTLHGRPHTAARTGEPI